jgi:leucyl aminopeptidase
MEGTLNPDSLCVIGGHYDNILKSDDPFTLVPGANDNASGVAATFEIARVMKNKRYRPESSIMFIAFGSEETGLWGSGNFAANPHGFSGKIRFMLNNDMIAYEPGSDPSAWGVNILDYDNSHNLRIEAEKICTRFTDLNFRNDNTYNKMSDSYPFFANGYKALFFTSDKMDPNYHTLNDMAANSNFSYCREITKISCALLAEKN